MVTSPMTKTDDLVERLLTNEPLPVCPYDRRSPDYWTTNDTDPCKICGQLNTADGPDLCRGADTRAMKEAAARIQSDAAIIAELIKALEPFADAADNMDGDEPDALFIYDSPESTLINYGHLRAARSLIKEGGE